MNFEEINLIIEGISKSQKEAGQRAMNEQNNQLKNQLISWFNDRWSAKNAHKAGLTIDKKKVEKERLDRILRKIDEVQNRGNTLDFRKRVKETTGIPVQWKTGELDQYSKNNNVAGRVVWSDPKKKKLWTDEEKQKYKTEPEDLIMVKLDTGNRNIASKLNSLHEYKHLSDMFKEIIINGKYKGGVSTSDEIKTGHIRKIQKTEGQANAHALDAMYRKDRLAYLTGVHEGKEIADAKLEKIPKTVKNTFKDIYVQGTVRYSKTLKKSKKNITPALRDTFCRILKSCFNTPEGKECLKMYNLTPEYFYNAKIKIDEEYNTLYKTFFRYSSYNHRFTLGDLFFDWYPYFLNHENAANFAKNREDLRFALSEMFNVDINGESWRKYNIKR